MAMQAMTLNVLRKSTLRSSSASTWMCPDDFELIQEGIDLEGQHDDASKAAVEKVTDGAGKAGSSDGSACASLSGSLRRKAILTKLRGRIVLAREASHREHTSWCSLPRLIIQHLRVDSPVGSVFTYSISTSSSLRALFLAIEFMSALLIITIFSSATGVKRQKGGDPDETDLAHSIIWRISLVNRLPSVSLQ